MDKESIVNNIRKSCEDMIKYMSPLEKVSTPFNLKVECQFPRIIPQ